MLKAYVGIVASVLSIVAVNEDVSAKRFVVKTFTGTFHVTSGARGGADAARVLITLYGDQGVVACGLTRPVQRRTPTDERITVMGKTDGENLAIEVCSISFEPDGKQITVGQPVRMQLHFNVVTTQFEADIDRVTPTGAYDYFPEVTLAQSTTHVVEVPKPPSVVFPPLGAELTTETIAAASRGFTDGIVSVTTKAGMAKLPGRLDTVAVTNSNLDEVGSLQFTSGLEEVTFLVRAKSTEPESKRLQGGQEVTVKAKYNAVTNGWEYETSLVKPTGAYDFFPVVILSRLTASAR